MKSWEVRENRPRQTNLDGCNLGDSTEIVSNFANFFSNVGSKVQSSVSNKYNKMNCNIINDVVVKL